MNALGVVGLVVSVIGGALGAFSILVTWKLYQAGNDINMKTLELLSAIRQSSHTSEVTSVHYTDRLVTALIELLQRDVMASLASGQESVTKRIDAAIQAQLASVDHELVEKVRSRVRKDVMDTFQTLRLQTSAVAQLAEPAPSSPPTPTTTPSLDPGAPRVIRWVARNERKYRFFSVRFLREKIFATDTDAQRGLQFCIREGLLELYEEPNPHDPLHPTAACRLNRNHPLTLELVR